MELMPIKNIKDILAARYLLVNSLSSRLNIKYSGRVEMIENRKSKAQE